MPHALYVLIPFSVPRPEALIEINLPPADGRYPGAVLVAPQEGQILPLRKALRPSQIPVSVGTVRVNTSDSASASLVGRWLSGSSSADAVVEITLDDVRLFEAVIDDSFRQVLLDDRELERAEKRMLNPRVVVRTYEAIVSFDVRRAANLSAEAWEESKKALVKAGGKLKDESAVSFTGKEPVVVAYETLAVAFDTTTMNAAPANKVKLTESMALRDGAGPIELAAFDLKTGSQKVRYSLLGNSRYRSDRFGNLSVVKPSHELVKQVFDLSGASALLNESKTVLTKKGLADELNEVAAKIRTERPSLFVLYYAGHAIAGPGGQLYLVMNDYEGDPVKDMGEDFLLGLPRAHLDNPSSPASGSNLQNLLDVVTALQAESPLEIVGLYPVSSIAKQLEGIDVPYILLIDGCYEHSQIDRLRESLHLTQKGDYFGPREWGGPDENERLEKAIRQFGQAPYLRSKNAVIFSATPGSVAVAEADPRPSLFNDQFVAPLAGRIYRRMEAAVAHAEDTSWGAFLQSIVDVKPLGERRVFGTVSWSDFSLLKSAPMLVK